MMDEYFAVPISPTNKRARAQMDALLEREGIERDRNLTYSAAIYDDDGQMIATGSLFENTRRAPRRRADGRDRRASGSGAA